MKQIICEHPNAFSLNNEAALPTNTAGNALVRISRVGICGTDLHAYRGNQPFFEYPRVLGHELAGYIEEIGPNEEGLAVGDLVSIIPYLECGKCLACRLGKPNCCYNLRVLGVHIDGGMQELLKVPVAHLLKADGLSPDQAVILEPLSIGAHAVRRAEIQPGEHVLVIGAGPIGLSVMAFAAHQGAKVSVMDINEERLNFARGWTNLEATFDPQDNPVAKLQEFGNGDFPSVVFDATGHAGSMMSSFNFASNGGKLIFVGLVKADITFNDPEFHRRELTLFASRNATKADFAGVKQAILAGSIDSNSYITHRTDADHLIDQFESLFDPAKKVIKTIVEF